MKVHKQKENQSRSLAEIILRTSAANFISYYKIWSEVRHGITHQAQEISFDCYNGFNKVEKRLFDLYFPSIKGDKSFILKIDSEKAIENLRLIAEYAFLIYKSLAMELRIEWKKMLKNYEV